MWLRDGSESTIPPYEEQAGRMMLPSRDYVTLRERKTEESYFHLSFFRVFNGLSSLKPRLRRANQTSKDKTVVQKTQLNR